jgi:2',3'-cyclic-nucleotide 2'-phosphodiesterase/3'-nucleotidase
MIFHQTHSSAHAHIRILQTTDLHMCVLPYDYVSDQSGGAYSLSRLAPVISDLRSDDVLTLLFDTGDFLQGNHLASYIMSQDDTGSAHPMIAAMNLLEYDAITLGNHDFDFGVSHLKDVIEDLDCPVVVTNMRKGDANAFASSVLLKRDVTCADGQTRPITIGVIGLITPQTIFVDETDRTAGYAVSDIVDAAAHAIPALKAEGADIIIALCHSGIGPATHTPGMENAALSLSRIAGIDAILMGHVHDVFPSKSQSTSDAINAAAGLLNGTPSVMPGAYGTHLGCIDLALTWSQERGWNITEAQCEALTIADTPDTPNAVANAIKDSVATLHQQALTHIAEPLTQTKTRIHSFFAQIRADDSLRLLSEARRAIVNQGLHATPYADLPLISSAAPYRAGGRAGPNHFVDIQPGGVTLRDVGALYPFADRLCGVLCSGAELRQRLEHTACQFNQITPGQEQQMLFNPDFPAYNADTLFGIDYEIDLTKPAYQGRISHLRYNGRPVDDTDRFVLAATTYRIGGGGGYDPIPQDRVIFRTETPFRDAFADYLKQVGTLQVAQPPVWGFMPISGTSAVFQSAPQAVAAITTLADRNVSAGPLRHDGFRDYILHL